MRNTITKFRTVNTDEENQQIAQAGDVHRDLNNKEVNDARLKEFEELKGRWKERAGKDDARQDDLLLGIKLQKIAPYENHEQRWKRQQAIYTQLDEVLDKMRTAVYGTKEYDNLNQQKLGLERAL